MTTAREVQANSGSFAQGALRRIRPWLSGRRIWWIAATLALAAGATFSWSWLVATGVAPLLVAALPCAAMCALGLCVHRMLGGSCSKEAAPGEISPKAGTSNSTLPTEIAGSSATLSQADAPAKSERERETVSVGSVGRGA